MFVYKFSLKKEKKKKKITVPPVSRLRGNQNRNAHRTHRSGLDKHA